MAGATQLQRQRLRCNQCFLPSMRIEVSSARRTDGASRFTSIRSSRSTIGSRAPCPGRKHRLGNADPGACRRGSRDVPGRAHLCGRQARHEVDDAGPLDSGRIFSAALKHVLSDAQINPDQDPHCHAFAWLHRSPLPLAPDARKPRFPSFGWHPQLARPVEVHPPSRLPDPISGFLPRKSRGRPAFGGPDRLRTSCQGFYWLSDDLRRCNVLRQRKA